MVIKNFFLSLLSTTMTVDDNHNNYTSDNDKY